MSEIRHSERIGDFGWCRDCKLPNVRRIGRGPKGAMTNLHAWYVDVCSDGHRNDSRHSLYDKPDGE